MAAYKNIAIFGASGNVGKIILDGLVTSSKFNITVLQRQESKATFGTGIDVRKTDFSDKDLENALKGQDAVISALGAAAFGEQKKIVDAAVRAGVKRFLPSEFSASIEDDTVLQLLPLFTQKKEIIQYLKTKQSEGFSWTGLATSGLFDWGLSSGFLGFDIAQRTATIWDGGNKTFTLTNEKQLGQAVVSVLEHPEETSNRYLYVYSVKTSQSEILAALEEETAARWTINAVTTEEQVSEAGKKLGAGDFEGAFILVRATVFGNVSGLRSDYTKEANLANEVLGLSTETVQDVVKRVVAST
ncbi:hypothetical protein AK830_g88 [Neonectria ditissima]|uniref:NmrA-like domain-containing protein n=1 Tax=Neonectria ditissima TaxID=78410 RepID=A0A0P7C3F6_9HYPO|nr:hypothetical protein AK830_g88 [Neonectria ditissima]